MTATRVTTSGPLFDGTAHAQIDAFQDAIERELAERVLASVQAHLRTSLKRPTGRYMARVQIDTQLDDLAVTDNRTVYGPWLEGTSTRNKSTRFKGYAAFRRAGQEVEARAGEIAEQVLPPYLARIQ